MQLARGATPVDLAFAVHTDVGNRCIAAKVDGRYVPTFRECEEGNCWVGITYFAASTEACRFLARSCRELYPGYKVYGIRDYGPRRRITQTVNRVAA